MFVRRIISAIMVLAIASSLFGVTASAEGIPKSNVSKGMYELKTESGTADFSEEKITKSAADEHTTQIDLNFTKHNAERADLINYSDFTGEEAKFAHTRFIIGVMDCGVDTACSGVKVGIRMSHYSGSKASLRFNLNSVGKSTVYGGDSDFNGYECETVWIVSSTKKPIYNTVDIVQDCETGLICIFVGGKLAVYATDGSTDGKFYGYSISKMENNWDVGDVFTVKFDENYIGHTIYKDTDDYKVSFDDVLSAVGISSADMALHRTKMEKAIKAVAAANRYVNEQKETFLISGVGMNIQAEDCSYTSEFYGFVDRMASDTKVLKSNLSNSTLPDKGNRGHLELKFKTDETACYSVWVRAFGANSSSDSFFYSFGDSDYANMSMTAGSYRWYRVHTGRITVGTEQKLRIRSREAGCCIDSILITRVPGFNPSGRYGDLPLTLDMSVALLDSEKYQKPPVTPPQNAHPRVLFRKEDIPKIRENLYSEQNAFAKANLDKLLSDTINTTSNAYSIGNLMRIEANAFDYAINDNQERGLAAKNGILAYLENNTLAGAQSDATTRNSGHTIFVASEVYDWCYDLFSEEEREKVILNCTVLSQPMEIGWPPSKQGAVTGHGNEAQLLRDLLAFSIATYDERPDFWNYIGGRYYQQYVAALKFNMIGLPQGAGGYGQYRQMWSTYSYLLITGMGAEAPIDMERFEDEASWLIYFRRPDGQMFHTGDTTQDAHFAIWDYWSVYPQGLVNAALLTKNEYLKLEIARSSKNFDYYSTNVNYASPIIFLVFNDVDVKPAKSFDNLPLSKYYGSPNGQMIARNGWEDGVESPAVVAQMNVGEWQANNHQHLDAGHFQLYYKGILASDSGVYEGLNKNTSVGGTAYGSQHFNQYETKTIAHNCMLVEDPSEGDKSSTSRSAINDGGQRAIYGANEIVRVEQFAENNMQTSKVEGMEIDRENTQKPLYTYLKGNLTNAYSDKVSDYKRSFMFLNLDNDKVPAALIVFDKIDSAKSSFKKTWLLHGLEEPKTDGNRTVFSRTYQSTIKDCGYNGKMTVDTLLPEKAVIKKVGGEDGWSNVNGKDYTGYPLKSQSDEGNTWRLEVSPSKSAEKDYFLNVMQVSDNDKNNYMNVELVDNELFYGVKISDRIVAFSKSGERVENGFEFTVPSGDECKYTICDVSSGTYRVSVNGKTQIVDVTEEGGVLSFTADAGSVLVEKTETQELTKRNQITQSESKNTESVNVRIDNMFVYNKIPAILKNDLTFINSDEFARYFNLNKKTEDDTLTLYNKGKSIKFTSGSNVALIDSEPKTMTAVPEIKNDIWMIPARIVVEAFNGSIEWDDYANTVFINLPPRDLSLPKGYVRISSVEPDSGDVDGNNVAENINDENDKTIWSAYGVGRYVTLELEKTSDVSGVEVMFNPNTYRDAAFEIQISEDGNNFTKVFSGKGDGSVEAGTWEKFDFDEPSNAKYVRYIGNGSNLSKWNAVKEIRVKEKGE